MPQVTVVHTDEVTPRRNPATGLIVVPLFGDRTGFGERLEQAVLELGPGERSETIAVDGADEVLFVISGEGSIQIGAAAHPIEPETGIVLPRATRFALQCAGPAPLRLVAVRVAVRADDPEPAPDSGPAVSRLSDQDMEPATGAREFRILADPAAGLRTATHFVGYIPVGRAPDHFHYYDEVIHVLDGEGVMHAGALERPLSAGSSIQLPAQVVHCLENTGDAPMRVVAVFRPAGSPAAAFYPDGTPAFQGT